MAWFNFNQLRWVVCAFLILTGIHTPIIIHTTTLTPQPPILNQHGFPVPFLINLRNGGEKHFCIRV